jgi:triphosphoribosyl-dephospho-CoA synthase
LKNCLNLLQLETFAAALIDGFKAELYLTPKPGLVDLLNNGAHPDLSLLIMSRSIVLLRTYLQTLCVALDSGAEQQELIRIGQDAEARMLEELGTNCHRGGIFLAGLLLATCRLADPGSPGEFQQGIKTTAERFFALEPAHDSHGQCARKLYQVGGIVGEACAGLPTVFEEALPALLKAENCPHSTYLAMSRLMQTVDDTTSLHRCGTEGLDLLRKSGRQIEQVILSYEDPTRILIGLGQEFSEKNLTMGGVADLLGISLGYSSYLLHERNISEECVL